MTAPETIELRHGCAYLHLFPDSFSKRGALIERAALELSSANNISAVIIDLIDVPSLDDATLRSIIRLQRSLHENGAALALRNLSASVTKLLVYLGLDDFLIVTDGDVPTVVH